MGTLLNLLPGSVYSIVRLLPDLRKRSLTLRVPLLELFIAHLEDLSLGVAQFFLISGCLRFSRSNRRPSLVHRTGGASATLCQHAVERTSYQQSVSCH